MKTNVKIIVSAAVALLAGYFIGALAGFPSVDSNSGKGDISKVSKFRMTTVSPQMNALQEKIMNDPQELKKATLSLTCLTSRMTEFAGLVDIAVDAASGKPGLEKSLSVLQSMKSLSENAAQAGRDAIIVFEQITGGKGAKNASAYEQASQNLSIAYLMVDRQLKVAKDFVADLDAYLRSKPLDENKKLALARDLWVDYCAGNAVISGDQGSLAYWNNQGNVLTPEQFAGALRSSEFANPSLLSAISFGTGVVAMQAVNNPSLGVLSSTVCSQLSSVAELCEDSIGFLPSEISNSVLANTIEPMASALQVLGSLPAEQVFYASTAMEMASLGSSSREQSTLGDRQSSTLGMDSRSSELSNTAERALALGSISSEMSSLANTAVSVYLLGSSERNIDKLGINSEEMSKLGQTMLQISQLGSATSESALKLSTEEMTMLGMVATGISSLNLSSEEMSILSNVAEEFSSLRAVNAGDFEAITSVLGNSTVNSVLGDRAIPSIDFYGRNLY